MSFFDKFGTISELNYFRLADRNLLLCIFSAINGIIIFVCFLSKSILVINVHLFSKNTIDQVHSYLLWHQCKKDMYKFWIVILCLCSRENSLQTHQNVLTIDYKLNIKTSRKHLSANHSSVHHADWCEVLFALFFCAVTMRLVRNGWIQ